MRPRHGHARARRGEALRARAGGGSAGLTAVAVLWCACARAAGLPDWTAQAIALPTPAWAARAPAVQLLGEESITVPRGGRIQILRRGVVRVQSLSGKEWASCFVEYVRGTSDVPELRAWIVGARGRVTRLDRSDASDWSVAGEFQLYSETRRLGLSAPNAGPRTVFAWEWVREEDPLLAQWPWPFQTQLPCLLSRVSLTLPDSLEPAAVRFGPDSVVVAQRGRTWTWERRDVRPLPREPLASVTLSNVSAVMLGVKGAGQRSAAGASFADWGEVARWLDELSALQSPVDQEVAGCAARLTASAADTLARAQALARAVDRKAHV